MIRVQPTTYISQSSMNICFNNHIFINTLRDMLLAYYYSILNTYNIANVYLRYINVCALYTIYLGYKLCMGVIDLPLPEEGSVLPVTE